MPYTKSNGEVTYTCIERMYLTSLRKDRGEIKDHFFCIDSDATGEEIFEIIKKLPASKSNETKE